MKPLTVIATVVMVALAVPAWAQDYEDEPGQGVARLSLVSGEVTVRRSDTGELIAGERNAPLVARDHVLTDNGARAEVQLDWANMIRLAPNTAVRLAELEDGNFLIQVDEGTVTFAVLRDTSTLVEISTPMISVRPTQQGNYRITVRPDGSSEVTVRSGEAEIFSSQRTETLRPGRTLVAQGNPDDPDSIVHVAIARDDWDRWNEDRDRDLNRSDSYKYVSRDIYGADDLAGHGRWVYDSPYGWVWAPNVAVSWAPYRAGRWVWINYYGWTWLSSDPWGWAPYHYGRWYQAPRHGWVWYPGDVGPRHYWRPALVGFFGWGSGVSVNLTFGFGNVGWVPLAPREVYRPWYGRRPQTVVNNVTVVKNVNIVNTYINARSIKGYNGVTSINSRDFGKKHVNVNNFLHATDRDLGRAGHVRGHVPLEASHESRKFSDRKVVAKNIPDKGPDRKFVRRDQPGGWDGKQAPANSNSSQPVARNREEPAPNQPSAFRREPASGSRAGAGPNVAASRRTESPAERTAGTQRGGNSGPQAAPATANATNGRGNNGNSGNNGQANSRMSAGQAARRTEAPARVENPSRIEAPSRPSTEPSRQPAPAVANSPNGRGNGNNGNSGEANSRMSAGQAARRTEVPARVENPSRIEAPSRAATEPPRQAAPAAATTNGRGNDGNSGNSGNSGNNGNNGQGRNSEQRVEANSRMGAGQAARRTEAPARVENPSRIEAPSRATEPPRQNSRPAEVRSAAAAEPQPAPAVRRGPEIRSGRQPVQPVSNSRTEAAERPAPRADNPGVMARRAPEASQSPRAATPAPPPQNDGGSRPASVFRGNGGNRDNGGSPGGGAVRSAPQERPAPSPAPAPPAAERAPEQRQPSALRGNGRSQGNSSEDNSSSSGQGSSESQGRGRGRR